MAWRWAMTAALTVAALVGVALLGGAVLAITEAVMRMLDEELDRSRRQQPLLERAEPYYRVWIVRDGRREPAGRADTLPEARAMRRAYHDAGGDGVMVFETAWW